MFSGVFLSFLNLSQSRAQSLSYSAYLPTSLSAQNITIYGMAVDSAGESCIVESGSTSDGKIFVDKFGSDAAMIYSVSTLNGGSLNGAGPAAMDSSGNCYVFGSFGVIIPTTGAFQITAPAPSAPWVAKFDGSGNTVFATYIGGSGPDTVGGIAVDTSGNVYLTGTTQSNDFPTKNPHQAALASGTASDAFIAVLNSTGTALIYSTYWGGTGGDVAYSITVDVSKNAYIAGGTCSTDFPTVSTVPTVPPFQSTLAGCANAFVIKLDPSGVPIYSTYLGGTTGNTNAFKVAADGSGAAYVAGSAESGFPLMNPVQSTANGYAIFLSKLNATGTALVYSTYLGDANGGDLSPIGLVVDSGGKAYVVGEVGSNQTVSLVSPMQSSVGAGGGPFQLLTDGFVSVVDSAGTALSFSTYLGGSYDVPVGVGVDSSGNIYVAGRSSATFPILNAPSVYFPQANFSGSGPAATQMFLLKISPSSGTSLSYPPTADVRTNPQPVGSSTDPFPLLVANTNATGDISISNIAIAGDFSQANNCPQTLPAGTGCYVQVTFTPTVGGWRVGTVTITDSAPGSPHVINLIGAGLVPQVTFTPTSLTFSTQPVGASSAQQTVGLTNSGGANLAITSISVSGDFSETNNCHSPLAAHGVCAIAVVFTPTAAGTRGGSLTVVDSASGSPHTVSLTGTGANPSLGLGLATGGSDTETVPAGTSATYMLALGGGGISGTASLSCTGAPQGATCTVPASQTVNATTPSNFNLSVTTTSRTTSELRTGPAEWMWAMTILGCVLLPAPKGGERSIKSSLGLLALVLVPVFLLSSCGSSSSMKTNPNGTPAGTYPLTVTAQVGANSQTMTLTLKVQ